MWRPNAEAFALVIEGVVLDVVVRTDEEFPQAYVVIRDVEFVRTRLDSNPCDSLQTRADIEGTLVPLANLYEVRPVDLLAPKEQRVRRIEGWRHGEAFRVVSWNEESFLVFDPEMAGQTTTFTTYAACTTVLLADGFHRVEGRESIRDHRDPATCPWIELWVDEDLSRFHVLRCESESAFHVIELGPGRGLQHVVGTYDHAWGLIAATDSKRVGPRVHAWWPLRASFRLALGRDESLHIIEVATNKAFVERELFFQSDDGDIVLTMSGRSDGPTSVHLTGSDTDTMLRATVERVRETLRGRGWEVDVSFE